jgi:hypothetical protein
MSGSSGQTARRAVRAFLRRAPGCARCECCLRSKYRRTATAHAPCYRVDRVDRLHARGSGNSSAIDVRLTTPRHDQVHPSMLYAVAGIGEVLEVLSGRQALFPCRPLAQPTSCTLLSSRKRFKLAARMRPPVVQPRTSTSTTIRGAIHMTLAHSIRLSELASAGGLPLSVTRQCHIALACSDVNLCRRGQRITARRRH